MAVDAATLAAKISVEGADRAKRELTGFSGAVEKNAQQLRKIGIGLTAVGATITGIGGIALKMAMDVTESENLFDVAMGDMGASAREFSIRLRDELGLNEFKIRENIGVLFQMTSAMGISRDSAFQMATGLTELSQDMASFFNLKPEEAFLKIQSGIVGEIEPLRRLGILVDETTTKNALMTAGLIEQGDELSQQQKVIGRYLAILEQTTNAQGDLARTIDSPINQLRVLRSQIEALLITIGNQLIPIVTPLIQKFTEVAQALGEWAREHPGLTRFIVIGTAAIGAFALALGPILIMLPGLVALGPTVAAATSMMAGGFGLLVAAINPAGLAIAALAVAFGMNLGNMRDNTDNLLGQIIGKFQDFIGHLIQSEEQIATMSGEMDQSELKMFDLQMAYRNLGLQIEEVTFAIGDMEAGMIADRDAGEKLLGTLERNRAAVISQMEALALGGAAAQNFASVVNSEFIPAVAEGTVRLSAWAEASNLADTAAQDLVRRISEAQHPLTTFAQETDNVADSFLDLVNQFKAVGWETERWTDLVGTLAEALEGDIDTAMQIVKEQMQSFVDETLLVGEGLGSVNALLQKFGDDLTIENQIAVWEILTEKQDLANESLQSYIDTGLSMQNVDLGRSPVGFGLSTQGLGTAFGQRHIGAVGTALGMPQLTAAEYERLIGKGVNRLQFLRDIQTGQEPFGFANQDIHNLGLVGQGGPTGPRSSGAHPGAGSTLSVNINGPVYGLHDLEEQVMEAITRRSRAGGFDGVIPQ